MGLVQMGGDEMGTLRTILFIAASLAVSNTYADNTVAVPYQFSDGGVASASQVNANFTALANAVTKANGDIASLQSRVGPSVTPTELNVTQTPLPPGSTITVGGVSYIIVRTSVPAFATDTRVWIDVPVAVGSGGHVISVASDASGSFYALNYSSSKIATTISGVRINCTEQFSYYISAAIGNTSPSSRSGNQSYSQYLACFGNIDANTGVTITLSIPTAIALVAGTASSPEDLSDVDPYTVTPVKSKREQIRSDLRRLLSYVVFSPGH